MKKIITLILLLAAVKVSYGKCTITQDISNVTLGTSVSYIAAPIDTVGPFYFTPGESIKLSFTVTGSSICVLSFVTWMHDSNTLPDFFTNNNSTTNCIVSDAGIYSVNVGQLYYFRIEHHPASVAEYANAIPVSIFPNPVSEKVNIQFDQSMTRTVTLFNAAGEILFHTTSSDTEFSFDAANLRKGIYFVKVQSGNQTTMKRVVKM